jgi:hypothetical protein
MMMAKNIATHEQLVEWAEELGLTVPDQGVLGLAPDELAELTLHPEVSAKMSRVDMGIEEIEARQVRFDAPRTDSARMRLMFFGLGRIIASRAPDDPWSAQRG